MTPDPFTPGIVSRNQQTVARLRDEATRNLVDFAVAMNARVTDAQRLRNECDYSDEQKAILDLWCSCGTELSKLMQRLNAAPATDLPKIVEALRQCYSGA